MTVTIESFGGKPYKAVCEVLEHTYESPLPPAADDIFISFGVSDQKLKNIEMDSNGYIQCEEYRYVSIMPNFASWATIIAGTVGTLDLEFGIHTILSEGDYSLTAHQCSLFPGHYEYDNSAGTENVDDLIGRADFQHADYFCAAQIFEIPSRHIYVWAHVTKENIELWAGSKYGMVLWFIP